MDEFSRCDKIMQKYFRQSDESMQSRYLWTDAFAVLNFLEMSRISGSTEYADYAETTIKRVHRYLGRYRDCSEWFSGLSDSVGENHPTICGLRIGKKLPERSAEEKEDSDLEWDRDGQYYHYLTKWMNALTSAACFWSDPKYLRWAVELAKAAHTGFVYLPGGNRSFPSDGRKRMYWKMSTDLKRPLVRSMGHHDPVDGLVSYYCIDALRKKFEVDDKLNDSGEYDALPEEYYNRMKQFDLADETKDMEEMCHDVNFQTHDPLGLGCLLMDCARIAALLPDSEETAENENVCSHIDLLERLLEAAVDSLDMVELRISLRRPAETRLAFRELGLAIGLKRVGTIEKILASQNVKSVVDAHYQCVLQRTDTKARGKRTSSIRSADGLLKLVSEIRRKRDSVGSQILNFWCNKANQKNSTWEEHFNINSVMLVTACL